jgi:hypothetical protein
MLHIIKFAAALLFLAALFSLRLNAQVVGGIDTTIRQADVPHIISYQGQIKSADGTATNGTHHITTTLYSDSRGINSVWQGAYDADIKDGIFTVMLGSGTSKLPQTDLLNQPLWIGIKVDGGEEMQPRGQLSAAPYALNVPDQSITLAKLSPEVALSLAGGGLPTPQVAPNWTNALDPYAAPGQLLGTNNLGGDLEIQAQATKVMHYNAAGGKPNINGGAPGNFIPIVGAGAVVASTIAGGGGFLNNSISSNSGFIGGGQGNVIDVTSDNSTIGGGDQNRIYMNSDHGVIAGGGYSNQIGDTPLNGSPSAPFSFIGGGAYNKELARSSTIAGGYLNVISGNGDDGKLSFIGGGGQNNIHGVKASIVGGEFNVAQADGAFIGGGISVVGSPNNQILSLDGTIGGGFRNMIDLNAPYSEIGGGAINYIWPDGQYSTIAGGWNNTIGNTTIPPANHDQSYYSSIGGGYLNTIHTKLGTIGGGFFNTIIGGTDDEDGTIGGGKNNVVREYAATVCGGASDSAIGPWSTASGGAQNTVQDVVRWVTGSFNLDRYAQAFFDWGAGGLDGLVNAGHASVPYNYPGPGLTLSSLFDNPLFMIGNGTGPNSMTNPDVWRIHPRHNAFEVSYNGHSTVFDMNGSGGAVAAANQAPDVTPPLPTIGYAPSTVIPCMPYRAAIEGSTFIDNIIYAWGDVTPTGNYPLRVDANADFGVDHIDQIGPGVYDIYLNTTDPDRNPIALAQGAVAITLINAPCNRFVTYSRFTSVPRTISVCVPIVPPPPAPPLGCQPNVGSQTKFTVTITQMTDFNGDCTNVDNDFSFIVTGRRQ